MGKGVSLIGLLAEPLMTIVRVELTLAPLSKSPELFTPYTNNTPAPSREEVFTIASAASSAFLVLAGVMVNSGGFISAALEHAGGALR